MNAAPEGDIFAQPTMHGGNQAMKNWTAPTVREISLAPEINLYACADL